ncbi:MAG: hypothetical protein ACI4Q4_00535 [Oscillospiraceae bacterium]
MKSRERTLACVTSGHVLSANELKPRKQGFGYAVIPLSGGIFRLWRRLIRRETLPLCSPASGTVTGRADDKQLTLRTGDGVLMSVKINGEGFITAEVGSRLARGEQLGTAPIGASALVLFENPEEITEFHICTGFRRRGSRAAFYCITRERPTAEEE